MYVDKRKKTQKQRQQHQNMMHKNYQEKLQEIEQQNALVAARKEQDRARMGVQAGYLAKIKEKVVKQTRDAKAKNTHKIYENQLEDRMINKAKAKQARMLQDKLIMQKEQMGEQQKNINRMNKQVKISALSN